MSDRAGAGDLRRGGPQLIPRPDDWRPGPPPPWGDSGLDVVDTDLVRRAIALREVAPPPAAADREVLPVELPGSSMRPAAVLCAVFDEPAAAGRRDAHVVLTTRSTRLRSHTGEVSFPGGRVDDGESLLDAALREAHEEIGLDPTSVEIIGQLSPLATMVSQAAVTPFVAVLPGRPVLRPNPAEVARVIMPPLAELWSPGVHHEERWHLRGVPEHPIYFFDLVGDTVWGATARMLRELLDLIWAARPR